MANKNKVGLIILDGWGNGDKSVSDAIHHANTPFVDSLFDNYPHSELLTDGENVGLPEGQMGNSEVGHLNIGAGRIVYQELTRINKSIKEKEINNNEVLTGALKKAKSEGKKLHFIGLVSKGGVHSSQEHLYALCDLANEHGLKDVFIHAFTDGRDCDPKSGLGYIAELEDHLKKSTGKIASIVGRYYAMDRDKRWERVKLAYDLLTKGEGKKFSNAADGIKASYEKNITDEFIEPITVVDNSDNPLAEIENGDIVICINFRTDRCREITQALTQQDFPEFGMTTLDLHYVTMTEYDKTFKNVNVIFTNENLRNTLGEVVSSSGLKQIRIAETEKYPHVTFFFSGGREKEFEGERRLMVSSPKVATYDLQPEMSAPEVTETIVNEIKQESADFICLNFANPDMVGHTGVYDAIIKAVETTDNCARQVVEAGLEHGYSFVIIADHGNADFVINPDGSPHTAHTTNPVPVFVINEGTEKVKNGILADVAPTILQILGIDKPEEMTGNSLI